MFLLSQVCCCRVAGGMGALSWVTVSINAHNFVTDVISGMFASNLFIAALLDLRFHL